MMKFYAIFIGLGCLISVHAIPLPLPVASNNRSDRTASNQSFVPPNSTVPRKSEMVLEDLKAAADSSGHKMGLFPVAYQSKLRTAKKAAATAAAATAAAAKATAKTNLLSVSDRSAVRQPLTKAGGLNFWAKPKAKPKGDAGNDTAVTGDGFGDHATAPGEVAPKISPRAGEGKIRTKSLEIRLSIPRLQSDPMGNWVFNPWGVTFGVLWQDTRMHYEVVSPMTEIIEDTPRGGHYAEKYNLPQTKVCRGLSTIYNKPPVYKWLQRRILTIDTQNFATFTKYRPIWLDMRREIYKLGRSEACHISAMDDWLLYNNCAILRNMRMEYLIPKYPLHQIGYWHPKYRQELTYKL